MATSVEFSVPFCAGKQRPRMAKSHAYKTQTETIREEAIALAFEEAGGVKAPSGVPVSVSICAQKKSKTSADKPFIGKPDADNVAKLVLDALNGRAWHDDSQVTRLEIDKLAYTAKVDRIHVTIDWREQ